MKKLLLLPFVALLLAATYGPPFSVSDFSSLTNRPNPSAINPVGVVLGRTSAYDGAGGLFVFNPAATNAIDDDIYLGTTTTGRWVRISRLVLLADNPLTLTNGQLSSALLTNYFSFLAGTNMQVTVTSNTVTYAMTNTATGSGGTNWYAYVVNTSQLIEKFGLIGNDSSDSYGELRWNVAATTNLLGGTNIFASIVDHKITNIKLDYTPTNSLLGSDLSTAAGSFANVGPIYVGANLLLSESGGVNTLSAIVSSGTNSWQIGVDGVVVTTPNLADASNVSVSASGTNVTFNLTATGVSAGTYSNATFTVDDRGRLSSASSSDLYSTLTNILAGGTNVVLTYGANLITINSSATGSGGGGAGTNAFVNGVLVQPLRMTNSASVLIYTNGSGDITFNVNDYDGFYSDLTNALVAGSNISFVYTNNTIRISSTSGGGSTNGTVVTVDGGADLARANFTDTTGINVANSGTNVTVNIIDRDFGDVTTSSSGTVITIDNSVITSNKLAAANVTQDKLSATGTATSTNFLAGDYTYKQVTTNMIPGLVNDITSLQKALSFTNGVTNINNVVSADLAAGSNISFSTNNGKITIASTASGSGLSVNGSSVSTPNFTNSNTALWNVSGTNISLTITNVPGATTSNALQWIGSAYFIVTNNSTIGDFSTISTNGIIYSATCVDCQNDSPGIIEFSFPSRSTNYVWTFMPEGNVNGYVAYEAEGYRTATSLRIKIHEAAGSVFFTGGYWMRFDFWDKVAVGGNGNAWDGTPVASGTVTNFVAESITLGGVSKTNWAPRPFRFSSSDLLTPESFAHYNQPLPWMSVPISSGTFAREAATAGRNGLQKVSSSTSANSGGYWSLGVNDNIMLTSNDFSEVVFKLNSTNAVVLLAGYGDTTSASHPVDCLQFIVGLSNSWTTITARARSNSVETVASDSYSLALNTYYRATTTLTNGVGVFQIYTGDSFPGTLVWSNTISQNIPLSPRTLAHQVNVWTTNATSATSLLTLDYLQESNPNNVGHSP